MLPFSDTYTPSKNFRMSFFLTWHDMLMSAADLLTSSMSLPEMTSSSLTLVDRTTLTPTQRETVKSVRLPAVSWLTRSDPITLLKMSASLGRAIIHFFQMHAHTQELAPMKVIDVIQCLLAIKEPSGVCKGLDSMFLGATSNSNGTCGEEIKPIHCQPCVKAARHNDREGSAVPAYTAL